MKATLRTTGILLSSLVTAFFFNAGRVYADNSYFVIAFDTLEDSSDPNSNVVFKTILELSESDRDGDAVGWQVDAAYFVQPKSGGDHVWKSNTVDVTTSDGLWWIGHVKADEPEVAEFDLPPLMSGQASIYNQSATQPLVYSLQGRTGSHGTDELRFDYSFRLMNESEPEEEEEDDIGSVDADPLIPPISVSPAQVGMTKLGDRINSPAVISLTELLTELRRHGESTMGVSCKVRSAAPCNVRPINAAATQIDASVATDSQAAKDG